MPATFGYWFPFAGQSLSLKLYDPAGGTVLNGEGGDDLTDSGDPSGYYVATVDEALPAKVRALVLRNGTVIDVLTHVLTAHPVQDLNDDRTGVDVGSISASAIAQLAGQIVVASIPTWQIDSFDQPIVRGDSYTGPRVLTIRLSGWTGPDLSAAAAIVLSAIRRPQNDSPFTWPVTATMDGDDWLLTLDLDTTQTDQAIGLYDFDVEATFSGGVKHTLVGPGARMQFVDDQTK